MGEGVDNEMEQKPVKGAVEVAGAQENGVVASHQRGDAIGSDVRVGARGDANAFAIEAGNAGGN